MAGGDLLTAPDSRGRSAAPAAGTPLPAEVGPVSVAGPEYSGQTRGALAAKAISDP